MRFFIIVFLCVVSLSASAQWYHIDLGLKKKHPVLPFIPLPVNHPIQHLVFNYKLNNSTVHTYIAPQTDFTLEAAENVVMKTAQHNMRFRVYGEASYNFSTLAQLFVQQNRLSEAKWYYLQSNLISRVQNDDKHTVANLMGLAMIKALLGDFASCDQDLQEARDMARSKGMQFDLLQVEKEAKYIQDNKNTFVKTEVRYADAVMAEQKAGQ